MKAFIKENIVYINNKLSFTVEDSSIWLSKEKCKIKDAFGNVVINFIIKHHFIEFSEIIFLINNINSKYKFFYNKNEMYWRFEESKYSLKEKPFSYRVTFYKNSEQIGYMDKNSFWQSYLDHMSFTFTTEIIEEVELCLLLHVIHSRYFPKGD